MVASKKVELNGKFKPLLKVNRDSWSYEGHFIYYVRTQSLFKVTALVAYETGGDMIHTTYSGFKTLQNAMKFIDNLQDA